MATQPDAASAGPPSQPGEATATEPAATPAPPAGPGRLDDVLGVLNAVLGDRLERSGNGLATPMQLFSEGKPVPLTREGLAAAYPQATGRLVLFVHGLGVHEGVWAYPGAPGDSYPALLTRELGLTSLTLRYNTGLHVSDNGERLAQLLQALVTHFPVPVEDLTLVGYSMGGLVVRSACHAGAQAGHAWLAHVRRAIYIGVPHLGSPLEVVGKHVAHLLRKVPNPYTRLVADVIDLRSDGVKDLGFANLVRQDWYGHEAEASLRNQRHPVPLLPDIAHHLVVGTLGADDKSLLALLFGDGVVRVASAAGRACEGHPCPAFPQDSVAVVCGVDHVGLAHHPAVYTHVRAWCAEGAKP